MAFAWVEKSVHIIWVWIWWSSLIYSELQFITDKPSE